MDTEEKNFLVNEMNDKLKIKLVPPPVKAPIPNALKKLMKNQGLNEMDVYQSDERIFSLQNIHVSFMNMLRYSLHDEVPTVAIEKIFLMQNTSVMPDEIIAQRLGLLPMQFDAQLLNYCNEINILSSHRHDDIELTPEWLANCGLLPEECLLFELKLLPRRDGPDQYNVYGESLKWIPLPSQNFSDPPRLAHSRIPLLRMYKDHEIHLLAVAVKGVGRLHDKFSPVSPIWFAPDQKLKLKESIDDELRNCLLRSLPTDMFKCKHDKLKLNKQYKSKNILNGSIEKAILSNPDFHGAIQVTFSEEKFMLAMESIGQYNSLAEVLRLMFKALQDKCRHYGTLMQNRQAVCLVDRESVTQLDPKGIGSNWMIPLEMLNGRQCGLHVYLAQPKQQIQKEGRKNETVVILDANVCTAVFVGEGLEWGKVLAHILLQRSEVKFVSVNDSHEMDDQVNIVLYCHRDFSALKLLIESLECLCEMLQIMQDKFDSAIAPAFLESS